MKHKKLSPEEKARRTSYNRTRKFGITEEQYEQMMEAQGGRCAICGVDWMDSPQDFGVDHDHATGKIRGLLCVKCNQGLADFKDDANILAMAIDYLRYGAACQHQLLMQDKKSTTMPGESQESSSDIPISNTDSLG